MSEETLFVGAGSRRLLIKRAGLAVAARELFL